MTSDEIIRILQACKASGVTSFKIGDLQAEFQSNPNPVSFVTTIPITSAPIVNPISIPSEEDLDPEIRHKVEELTSIMKLDDDELVNRMFPLPEENEGVA